MANNNPQYYQEYFDKEEALAFCEQVRVRYPGIECKPVNQTWTTTTDRHQAGDYLYTSVCFYNNGRFVTAIRSEQDFNDLLTLARVLTNVGVFS